MGKVKNAKILSEEDWHKLKKRMPQLDDISYVLVAASLYR